MSKRGRELHQGSATKRLGFGFEDGFLYREDLRTNQLTEHLKFNNGLGESSTPTAVGADGAVYVINNEVLFAVARWPLGPAAADRFPLSLP